MPKPKPTLIKEPAQRDLREIAKETTAKWGKTQKDRYLSKLSIRIRTLAYTPKMGPQREDLGEGRRVLACGKHLIFYRIINGRPQVSRVLHANMDLKRELDRARSKSRDLGR